MAIFSWLLSVAIGIVGCVVVARLFKFAWKGANKFCDWIEAFLS